MSTDGILDLIDSAVHDWETGPDAVRYNAPKPAANPAVVTGVTFAEACANLSANLESMRSRPSAPRISYSSDATLVIEGREIPVTDFRIEERRPNPRPVPFGAIGMAVEFERQMLALTQGERDEFVAYWQASPWSFEQAWGNWVARRAVESTMAELTVQLAPFARAMALAAQSLSQLFKALTRKPCGAQECFCHPAPFPAARDYRRRTKHRNRRRR